MLAHCRKAYPDEACGLLAGAGDRVTDIFELTNTEPSPVSYFMDPQEQFRALKEMRGRGLQLTGIFHSHPQSPAYPSSTDIKLAFYDEVVYVIASFVEAETPVVKAYRITGGSVSEVLLHIE